jgi:hypothetical protein
MHMRHIAKAVVDPQQLYPVYAKYDVLLVFDIVKDGCHDEIAERD